MPARKRVRLEHTEQAIFVSRVNVLYPGTLLFAVPNGGKRDKREAVRLKDEGVLAGASDLVLLEARGGYHGAVIEMKRSVGGVVSQEQADFLARARANGFRAIVAYGVEEAWEAFEEYMRGEPTLIVAEQAWET